jgi:hypothetical protein
MPVALQIRRCRRRSRLFGVQIAVMCPREVPGNGPSENFLVGKQRVLGRVDRRILEVGFQGVANQRSRRNASPLRMAKGTRLQLGRIITVVRFMTAT